MSEQADEVTIARVVDDHAPVHAQVLVVREGERVRLGREDAQWPGWIWCISESGTAGWTPASYLVRDGDWARLRVDYDATELTVRRGEQLALHYEVNDWWWATDAVGNQGWVPAAKVALL